MVAILEKLIYGHYHKWVIFHKVDVYDYSFNITADNLPIGTDYHSKCEICGRIKITKLR